MTTDKESLLTGIAGWRACRDHVYGILDKAIAQIDIGRANDFEKGVYHTVEFIKNVMKGFEPSDRALLADALGDFATTPPKFGTGDEVLDVLLAQTWALDKTGGSPYNSPAWREAMTDYRVEQEPRPVFKEDVKAVFMQNGFTIKEGQTDLKPYVYDAAEALLSLDGGRRLLGRPRADCVHVVRPDGSIRRNVGSDNLSDEDRAELQRNNGRFSEGYAAAREDNHGC